MKKRIELLRRLFRFLCETAFALLMLRFLADVVFKTEVSLPCYFLVPIVFAGSYVIREYTTKPIQILLTHILFFLPPVFLAGSLSLYIVVTGMTVLYVMPDAMHYVARGGKLKEGDDTPWPLFLGCVVAHIYGYAIENDGLMKFSLVVLILILALYFCRLYVDGMKKYMDSNLKTSTDAVSGLITVNTWIVAGIIFLFLIAAILGSFLDFSAALRGIGTALLILLKVLAQFFRHFWTILSFMIGKPVSEPEGKTTDGLAVTEEEVRTAERSGGFILTLITLAVIAFFLYRFLRFFIRWLLKRGDFTGDVYEQADSARKKKESDLFDPEAETGFFSRYQRARRAYKNRIRRNRFEIALKDYRSCGEIEGELSEKGLDDVEELTTLYEEIRYGDRKVDKETLKAVNRLAR